MSAYQKRHAAFTLMELMIVVTIIVLLMGLLVGALSAAKRRAYEAKTRSLLTGISTACESYFIIYDAYPGPVPPAFTATKGTKLSGTQNLFLGLSYPVYPCGGVPLLYDAPSGKKGPTAKTYNGVTSPKASSYTTGSWMTVPGTSSPVGYVHPLDTVGPFDLSALPIKSIAPFYNPMAKEMPPADSSGTWPKGGVTCGSSTGWTFPTILDRYPDPLPILYYRKTPGVDGTATGVNTSPASVITSMALGNPAIVSDDYVAASPASYYLDDNIEYTSATNLISPSGAAFDETQSAQHALKKEDLATYVSNVPLTANAGAASPPVAAINSIGARGGFVLISAGYDRLYGYNQKKLQIDDIVVVGGH